MERDPKLLQSNLESLARARKQTLNVVEAAFGHLPQWERVRGRILSILGRNGLEGALCGTVLVNGTEENEQTRLA